uniref:Endoplasmic reticulum chaperone BIP n=1 Tax=Neobenedenia melleni TaxID=280695 RepID=F8J499_9PLAT|nr:heat shock protein 78 [Neobenedenia melleni]
MKLVTFLLISFAAVVLCEEEKPKVEKPDYGTIIGIDLGTTYSCVGVMSNGRVEIIANEQGNRITPSYVAFTEDGSRLIGDSAKNQLTTNPRNTIFDVKRLIGRKWTEEATQKDIKHFPFSVIEKNEKPNIYVKVGEESKEFAPEEISAMVLSKMKEVAEAYLGKKVTHAVVTVPAYFNDAQRQATKNAGTISGLTVLRIINEPTAAAIAYGLDKKNKEKAKGKERQVLVFDLGGGTFDVSLLTIDEGVFEVVATSGNTHLGGEDFDQRVIDHFIGVFNKKKGKDISKNARAVQKLRREVEKAKRALSSAHSTKVEIESLIDGEDFSETLTRAKFEELNNDLFLSTLEPVKKVIQDAKIEKAGIDDIVLVGGSTRIPKIQALVKEFFDGREPNTGINPDEAVAYGAAIQGSVLSGDSSTGDLLLLDVCPLTLGMELEGGVMAKIISRNTPIPTIKRDTFTTVHNNQQTVMTAVYEGERPMVKDNHFLGQFELTGIPPAPAGMPQIEVTFEIDANGILKVSAEDKATGNKRHIVIRNDKDRLKPDEIEKMIKDAEKFKEEDEKVRARIEAISSLEQYTYSMKNQLSPDGNLASKLSSSDLSLAQSKLADAVSWIDSNKNDMAKTKEDYVAKKTELERAIAPILEKLYAGEDKKKASRDEL